ncbi:hypothetical protein [Rhizobium sp. BR 314]|uniref:hypothetical protein n=1 Tax=Rhizobium sp. BR 314 TaxID=3040013 RepID=UPI0039BFD709
MVAGIGFALAAFIAATFPSVGGGRAAETAKSGVPFAYALLLDGKDAIYGQTTCQIKVTCQLIDNQKTRVRLSVIIDSTKYLAGEVRVDCGEIDCSFSTSKASARLEGRSTGKSSRQFDLFAGERDGFETYLVYRKREKIGQVLLFFGNR